MICCGDFNSHSTLWDSYNDGNGEVIEELMEIKMVGESAMDLTLVSETVASIYTWEIVQETMVGSDHYPIITGIGVRLELEE